MRRVLKLELKHALLAGGLFFGVESLGAQELDSAEIEGLRVRVEELSEELGAVREVLSEQQASMQRLESTLLRRYIELDHRITGTDASSSADASEELAGAPFQLRLQAAVSLVEQEEYAQAEDMLADLLVELPEDHDAPLAWYWLGEIQLHRESMDSAEQSFGYLIAAYPGHWRVPAATYRLGEVHRQRGDVDRARIQFNRVIDRYPQSAAARVAELALDAIQEEDYGGR